MKTIGRPRKRPEEKAQQFNLRLPPDVINFLTGKDNKSKLIIEAMRKYYKIGKRKRIYPKA